MGGGWISHPTGTCRARQEGSGLSLEKPLCREREKQRRKERERETPKCIVTVSQESVGANDRCYSNERGQEDPEGKNHRGWCYNHLWGQSRDFSGGGRPVKPA